MPDDPQSLGDDSNFGGSVHANQAPAGSMTEGEFSSGGEGAQGQPLATQSTPGTTAGDQYQANADQAQAQQEQSLIDLAESMGYSFGPNRPTDPYTGFTQILSQAQQARLLQQQLNDMQHHAALGRQLAPHAEKIIPYLQQQAKPAGPKPYEPPAFDQRWTTLLEQDPNSGVYYGKPGTPMEIVQAANAYADYRREFLNNPTKVIEQMIEARTGSVEEMVAAKVQAGIQQYQQQQQVQQIVQQNAAWAFAKNADGTYQTDFNGQYLPSQLGQQYVSTVQYLAKAGVADPVVRDQIAKGMLQAQIATASGATQNQQAANARQQQALRQQQTRRNPLQGLSAQERRETPNASEPSTPGRSMRDVLNEEFQQAGITDQHWIQSSMGNW